MAFIKSSNNRSTLNYRFSVYTKDDKDLKALQNQIAEHNKNVRRFAKKFGTTKHAWLSQKLMRIRVMGRGPRKIWSLQDYPHNKRGSSYDSYLPQKYAEYFDVYVCEDHDQMNALQVELETGMTASMQRRKAQLEYEACMIEWEGKQRLQNAA